ncbi:hypothetical protein LX36DRAFT_398138 [Colletotrichum falcatum]|nr:hypothetical protein LX36DRAFT_398138 [Colletotrichum falcatum]
MLWRCCNTAPPLLLETALVQLLDVLLYPTRPSPRPRFSGVRRRGQQKPAESEWRCWAVRRRPPPPLPLSSQMFQGSLAITLGVRAPGRSSRKDAVVGRGPPSGMEQIYRRTSPRGFQSISVLPAEVASLSQEGAGGDVDVAGIHQVRRSTVGLFMGVDVARNVYNRIYIVRYTPIYNIPRATNYSMQKKKEEEEEKLPFLKPPSPSLIRLTAPLLQLLHNTQINTSRAYAGEDSRPLGPLCPFRQL